MAAESLPDLVRMAALVYLVRAFEEKVLDLKEADLVHGPAHTSVGQEAVAAEGLTGGLACPPRSWKAFVRRSWPHASFSSSPSSNAGSTSASNERGTDFSSG